MKGKSIRRRQKNALAAKSANLYKAQFGKASKWDSLPEPPQARDMTRSTRVERKMKAMLDLMSSEKTPCEHVNPREDHSASFAAKVGPGGKLTGTNNAAHERVADSTNGTHQALGKLTKPVSKGNLKRKFKLDERKNRRKSASGKQGLQEGFRDSKAPALLPDPKSTVKQAADPFSVEAIPFGEVAAHPPEVNLKRRHWGRQNSDPHGRHAEVLRKHLQIGESRLKRATEDVDANHDQRTVTGAYRAVKARSRPQGNATMSSLKALVHAGSAGTV